MHRLLEVRDLVMRYPNGFVALRGVNVHAEAGELVAILGSNGCGKSTLLRCIVRLLDPLEGSVRVDGHEIANVTGRDLRAARRQIAIVSQKANLVGRRSVIANVASGMLGRMHGWRTALGSFAIEDLRSAVHHLRAVGLEGLCVQRAGTLSGGQAQRVAIARALAQQPRVLLADEPVASLDPEAADDVLAILRRLADEGLATVAVLHQPDLALRYADRIIGMRAGTVVFDMPAAAVSMALVSTLYAHDVAA